MEPYYPKRYISGKKIGMALTRQWMRLKKTGGFLDLGKYLDGRVFFALYFPAKTHE